MMRSDEKHKRDSPPRVAVIVTLRPLESIGLTARFSGKPTDRPQNLMLGISRCIGVRQFLRCCDVTAL